MMFQLQTALACLPLLLSAALASPFPKEKVERASCAYTCGSHCYTSSAVSAAQAEGYSLYKSGETLNDYPHVYHDYEGFDFSVSGTYYEFPILSDGDVYDGGSPGTDRVIFNTADKLAGVITHTGASSSSGFVECT